MTLLVLCAVAGVTVAALGVLLDGVIDAFDVFDLGPDWLSLPVVGVGVGAFGITGASVLSATASTTTAFAAGAVAGAAFFAGTARLMVALMRSHSDATPTNDSVVGAPGRVITPIGAAARGEVLLRVAGQDRKYTATAAEDLEFGSAVVAIEALSDTTVRVESATKFWDTPVPGEGRNPQ